MSMREWVDGFRRDTNPDQEIAIWERISSTYLEAAYSCPESERQKIYDQVFDFIGLGNAQGVSEEIFTRCSNIQPIEGKEVETYGENVLEDVDGEVPKSERPEADVVSQDVIDRLRLDELKSLVKVNSAIRVDVSEFSEIGVRNLLAECDVIIGEDRNTGARSAFYGKEAFEIFARRREPGLVFPRPVMIVTYDNSSDDLEKIFALVQHLKGACCYKGASRKSAKSSVRSKRRSPGGRKSRGV
ncbi:hypothetical protein [Bradyrhizobium sp. STM 3809]|uniref:hypothetical protein n=1 Tax=Bradyrhizobium sp. STM 3809 TaxID=551936 RepID=UPI00111265CF|nr:hypothetical protein [Bradyrhizobium sp. STM 3809]